MQTLSLSLAFSVLMTMPSPFASCSMTGKISLQQKAVNKWPKSASIGSMRKAIAVLLVSILPFLASGASITGGTEVRPGLFYSEEELGKTSFGEELSESERSYYGQMEISLITASPAEPVYLYFGHSALNVKAPGKDAVSFDWGTFAFSPDFYRQFAFGLLYYDL